MNQQTKELATKYFWEQKRREVFWGFLILLLTVFVPYGIGRWMGVIYEPISITWSVGALVVVASGLILLFWVIIRAWISSNWEKANDRAQKELKKLRKKK